MARHTHTGGTPAQRYQRGTRGLLVDVDEHDHDHNIAGINLFEALLRMVGSGTATALGSSLTAVMAEFLAGRCVSALLYLRLAELPRAQWRRLPVARQWRAMQHQVPAFLGIALLAALSNRLDVLALSHLVSLDALDQYAAGVKLYEAAMSVPSLAAMVILPPLARLFKDDRNAFADMLPKAIRLLLAVGSPIAIVGAACAPATVDPLLSSVMLASHAQRQDPLVRRRVRADALLAPVRRRRTGRGAGVAVLVGTWSFGAPLAGSAALAAYVVGAFAGGLLRPADVARGHLPAARFNWQASAAVWVGGLPAAFQP